MTYLAKDTMRKLKKDNTKAPYTSEAEINNYKLLSCYVNGYE
jgi:hypothetical protein